MATDLVATPRPKSKSKKRGRPSLKTLAGQPVAVPMTTTAGAAARTTLTVIPEAAWPVYFAEATSFQTLSAHAIAAMDLLTRKACTITELTRLLRHEEEVIRAAVRCLTEAGYIARTNTATGPGEFAPTPGGRQMWAGHRNARVGPI